MPEFVSIPRAWQHDDEPTRIHYILITKYGNQHHLVVDEGSKLYGILQDMIHEESETVHRVL